MKLQTIISTMNKSSYEFLEKMNLESDVLVINQFNKFSYLCECKNNYKYEYLTINQKGLSKSRNLGLLCCSGDILLLTDDDVTFFPGYKNVILEAFEKYPQADIISFQVIGKETNRKKYMKKSSKNKYYCSVSLAYKKASLSKNNLWFHTMFGSGSIYLNGEESLLLRKARKSGLKIYECNKIILSLRDSKSSWFNGFNEKYFYSKGAWLCEAYPYLKQLIKYYYAIRINKSSEIDFIQRINWLKKGIKGYKTLTSYEEWREHEK